MADPEDCRVFVGGLSWDTTDKALEQAFRQFGKVVEARVMHDRDTGRPRGFGFVTFADEQSMEDAIAELHNGELDGRTISVNKAQPKMSGAGNYDYGGGYSNGGSRGGYSRVGGSEDCFKCGKPGHWARECPFGPGSGRFPPRYSGGGGGGRNDRYGGGGPGYSGRDRERERFGRDRYGDSYGRDTRGGYGRESGRDRYGSGGPARYGGGYRDRAGPYDRPGGGRSFYDDHY